MDTDRPNVEQFVQMLQGVQDTFIAIGRYIEGGSTAGRLTESVRANSALLIKRLNMNSPPEAVLALPLPCQQTIDMGEVPEKGFAEQATEIFYGLNLQLVGLQAATLRSDPLLLICQT